MTLKSFKVLKYTHEDLVKLPYLELGIEGEGLYRCIEIIIPEWRADHPGAAVSVVARNSIGEAYPVDVQWSGGVLTWIITKADTAHPGYGSFEITMKDANGATGKIPQVPTYVVPSLVSNRETLPDPYASWASSLMTQANAVINGSLRYDVDQELTDNQKQLARTNLDIEAYISAVYETYTGLLARKSTHIVLPAVESIGKYAFYACADLISVVMHNATKVIGQYAFYGCGRLENVTFPSSLETIEDNAFLQCGIGRAKLPASLITVEGYAFHRCPNLTEVTFFGTPTTIGENAFALCDNLTSIKVPWVQGAVAGAPWGANNAVVTYNYRP